MKRILLPLAGALVISAFSGAAFAEEERNRHHQRLKPGQIFEKMDANGDGQITQEEVSAAKIQRFSNMLEKLDTDGSNSISLAEMQESSRKRGEEMFGKLDANSDGEITEEEFIANNDRFTKMDTNGDGIITQDEFPKKGERKRQRRGAPQIEDVQ